MHALMYILHEIVEMDPSLGPDVRRQSIKEQVHQHGLATAHIAVHVQPLRKALGHRGNSRLAGARTEQRAKEGLFGLWIERFDAGVDDRGRIVVLQRFEEILEVLDNSWYRKSALITSC